MLKPGGPWSENKIYKNFLNHIKKNSVAGYGGTALEVNACLKEHKGRLHWEVDDEDFIEFDTNFDALTFILRFS